MCFLPWIQDYSPNYSHLESSVSKTRNRGKMQRVFELLSSCQEPLVLELIYIRNHSEASTNQINQSCGRSQEVVRNCSFFRCAWHFSDISSVSRFDSLAGRDGIAGYRWDPSVSSLQQDERHLQVAKEIRMPGPWDRFRIHHADSKAAAEKVWRNLIYYTVIHSVFFVGVNHMFLKVSDGLIKCRSLCLAFSGDVSNSFAAACTQFPSHRQAARGTWFGGGLANAEKKTIICGILTGSLLQE